jgi:hypothetical protein
MQLYPSMQHFIYANIAEELQLVEVHAKVRELTLVQPGFVDKQHR